MRHTPFGGDDRAFKAFEDLWGRFPFGELDRMGRGFSEANVSLERDDDGYVVLADIPGFEKDDLDIRYEDGHLVVTGEHETASEDGHAARRRRVHERVRVPGDVLVEDITASLQNGVLEVHLPLPEGETTDGHRIDIE